MGCVWLSALGDHEYSLNNMLVCPVSVVLVLRYYTCEGLYECSTCKDKIVREWEDRVGVVHGRGYVIMQASNAIEYSRFTFCLCLSTVTHVCYSYGIGQGRLLRCFMQCRYPRPSRLELSRMSGYTG